MLLYANKYQYAGRGGEKENVENYGKKKKRRENWIDNGVCE